MKLMILPPSFASDLKEKNGSNFLTIEAMASEESLSFKWLKVSYLFRREV